MMMIKFAAELIRSQGKPCVCRVAYFGVYSKHRK